MLLLVFATTAHAGRREQMGLLALTTTAVLSSDACRIAFVLAGTALASLITAPSAIRGPMMGETGAMLEAAAVGAFTSATAIIPAALTRPATAPRMVLLFCLVLRLGRRRADAGR